MAPTLVCWDSSVLIEHLIGDKADPDRRKDISAMLVEEERNNCQLVFSTLIYPEILSKSKKMSDESMSLFEKFLKNKEKRPTIAVDIPVAKKAQEIRGKTNLRTPDAILAATAIVSKSCYFHTFDTALLGLNGKPEVGGLAITACTIRGVTPELFD